MITLIDYYADWCGPCQAMKPIFEKVSQEYSGKVEIVKVDVDKEPEKSQQAGVLGIPTLIMQKDGKEIGRKTGLIPEPDLKQWIDSNLG